MKARNKSEINKKAKSWLGLLNYRLAQDSADAGEFPGRLKDIACDAIQDCNFDALPKQTVNTDPLESKTRLIRDLRSSKSQKRAGDYLEAYRYSQEVQMVSEDKDSIRTFSDYIVIWAKATDQEPIQFMQRVAPKLKVLFAKWQEETGCSGLTDSETLAHPKEASKFQTGVITVLVQETPADKLQMFANQICQNIQGLTPQELLSLLAEPLTQASTMVTDQATHRIQEALTSNPTAKEAILQPEFGALAELGARNCGWHNNYQQTADQLRDKLGQELAAQGVEVNVDLTDRTISKLGKNDIIVNLRDAISGDLHKRYIETATTLWYNLCQRVKSIWQFQDSESSATKDNILDFLFRREK